MTNPDKIKQNLGEQTEKLENKVGELWEDFSPHYTNLEPWQRGLVLIAILALLAFAIYYLFHESEDKRAKRKAQAEIAMEDKIIKKMELLKRLRE
ncbi:hypothetical protein [endosymbiont GvMRE of Glomus versiforme]|uniref:hypothetical protein n=1 Tax=endosymbiont GvMRE of Glomus versiforme TaxID=2039283 RepID=UPI000ED3FD6D|nr:hypothetical protein [endosymbiont GvMRE of Glomus versiforme]RHZ35894.1 hypothetical protein GvMRE_Ic4g125 [endosymbiont GvMRE of Glomus versiforme]